MSRNSKDIIIGDNQTVTVFELTTRDIKNLWKSLTELPTGKEGAMLSDLEIMNTYWDKCIHGLKLADSEDLVPSELKKVYDAFKEVNAVFFDLALKVEGDDPFLKALRLAIVNDLMLKFAAYSSQDTQTSGIMDTVSSLPQLKKTKEDASSS